MNVNSLALKILNVYDFQDEARIWVPQLGRYVYYSGDISTSVEVNHEIHFDKCCIKLSIHKTALNYRCLYRDLIQHGPSRKVLFTIDSLGIVYKSAP